MDCLFRLVAARRRERLQGTAAAELRRVRGALFLTTCTITRMIRAGRGRSTTSAPGRACTTRRRHHPADRGCVHRRGMPAAVGLVGIWRRCSSGGLFPLVPRRVRDDLPVAGRLLTQEGQLSVNIVTLAGAWASFFLSLPAGCVGVSPIHTDDLPAGVAACATRRWCPAAALRGGGHRRLKGSTRRR